MGDARYFTTTKKGEIFELKTELNSDKRDRRRDAVKKVIASMTVGKDVSALFPDVVNCMQTDNLELKKLVYLYLMNYAKSQPDLAIMAVNTFVKDCEDPNPLIRALAVRTMGCIRVDKITEYLCEPLRKCLKDEDPYVRKTAAVCVAKLHDMSPSLVEDQGFLVPIPDPLVTRRWGQVFILDSLNYFTPKDEREAQNICERISPRLAHANAAVVLSAAKVLLRLMEMMQSDNDFLNNITKKLAPPLVTLLSAEPEIQYVALRNINLIVQKRPEILKHEMKVFFVKYNDPIYVKMEKLDIMIRLANQQNIAQVLSELKEYATEVDVDFVRKSVRAIGRCAIKVESSAERCVSTLLDLIQTKVNYVVQEAIVVIKDIFRKYPNKYESVISTLCENLDTLDEPEARASMVWIIGEYAERIENADELLESFLDGFQDENTQVQLQLLTAIVKLFLKRPADTQELVQRVLSLATQDSDNPDLRDRGYIYWRLLSADPATAKQVVLAERPLISEETDLLEPSLLDELMCYIGTLASVYHKPPSTFVEATAGQKNALPTRDDSENSPSSPANGSAAGGASATQSRPHGAQINALGGAMGVGGQPPAQQTVIPSQDALIADLLNLDLGGGGGSGPQDSTQSYAPAPVSSGLDDLLGLGSDSLIGGSSGGGMGMGMQEMAAPSPPTVQAPMSSTIPPAATQPTGGNMLDDIFGGGLGGAPAPAAAAAPAPAPMGFETGASTMALGGVGAVSVEYVPPKQLWLPAVKGKGLEITGTMYRQGGRITMGMTFSNKAMQPMNEFAVQFNKNSFGVTPAQPLSVRVPLAPSGNVDCTLPLSVGGPVMKMDPLMQLQVAVKNDLGVHYFAVEQPIHVYFADDGQIAKGDFLQLWKEIPEQNELKFAFKNVKGLSADDICARLQTNNVFTVARRVVDGQEMLYHSIKFTNNIRLLSELKMPTTSGPEAEISLALKTKNTPVIQNTYQVLQAIIQA